MLFNSLEKEIKEFEIKIVDAEIELLEVNDKLCEVNYKMKEIREVIKSDYQKTKNSKRQETKETRRFEQNIIQPQSKGGCFISLFSSWRPAPLKTTIETRTTSNYSHITPMHQELNDTYLNDYSKGSMISKDSFGAADIEENSNSVYFGKSKKETKRRKPQI